MIISTITMCAIVVYRESRGSDFKSQYMVASTVYNRAVVQNKPIDEVIYQPHQYSSMTGTKKRIKFKTWQQMLSYYKINDMTSFGSALNACGLAVDNKNGLMYFHDKSISNFKWNKNVRASVTTKDFKFYKG